jgi:sterol desaturase/sphingolipid hydroxylase (fatty acid hydroxylase superfamily)/uncharacterized protein (DUF2147 family)
MNENGLLATWMAIFAHDLVRYLVPASVFFLVFWIWKKEDWKHLRIQDAAPPRGQVGLELRYSLSTVLIFSLVGLFLHSAERAGWTRIYSHVSERGWIYFALSTLLLIVLHDAYFYWTHRAMHLPWIYALVHRLHHRSTSPTPWAAYSFHPLEALVQAAYFPLVAFTVPVHGTAMFLFLTHMIVRNVIGHLGYELLPRGFASGALTRWVTTTTHHDLHHRFPRRNFGLYFTWWDEVFGGTHPGYRETFERIRARHPGAAAALLSILVLFFGVTGEAASSVEGRWKTLDSSSGEPRAVVRIEVETESGELVGVIERIHRRDGESENPTCGRCRGARKGRRVLGMRILEGFRLEGGKWVGGTILDPETGKEYRSLLWLDEEGKLKVRGYWGPFRRTETWIRLREETLPDKDVSFPKRELLFREKAGHGHRGQKGARERGAPEEDPGGRP